MPEQVRVFCSGTSEGAEVLSVDRGSHAALPLRFRKRFYVVGLRENREQAVNSASNQGPDLLPAPELFKKSLSQPKKALVLAREYLGNLGVGASPRARDYL